MTCIVDRDLKENYEVGGLSECVEEELLRPYTVLYEKLGMIAATFLVFILFYFALTIIYTFQYPPNFECFLSLWNVNTNSQKPFCFLQAAYISMRTSSFLDRSEVDSLLKLYRETDAFQDFQTQIHTKEYEGMPQHGRPLMKGKLVIHFKNTILMYIKWCQYLIFKVY